MLLILPDTGEEVRVPFDAPIEWAVAEWCRETGQPHEPGHASDHGVRLDVLALLAPPLPNGPIQRGVEGDAHLLARVGQDQEHGVLFCGLLEPP